MQNPPHPGALIRKYLGKASVAAAKHLGVDRVTMSRILNGKAAVSPKMAVRLARAFDTSTPEGLAGDASPIRPLADCEGEANQG